MPLSSTKPAALLLAVAFVLALLVGLVGSAGRADSRPRSIAPAEPREPGRASVVLRTPVAPLPDEVEPPPAPARKEKKPAPPSRSARVKLTGIVLRPEGEPAAGAQVVLGQQHAGCDPEGRFELELSADVGSADLVAFEPGHEPVLRPVFGASLGAGGENSVRLVLGPETLTLSGTVVGTNGQPLEGWTVELDGHDLLATFGLREAARTDGDGRFTLGDVSAGVHVVRAWKDRRELAFRSAPAAAGETGISIVAEE